MEKITKEEISNICLVKEIIASEEIKRLCQLLSFVSNRCIYHYDLSFEDGNIYYVRDTSYSRKNEIKIPDAVIEQLLEEYPIGLGNLKNKIKCMQHPNERENRIKEIKTLVYRYVRMINNVSCDFSEFEIYLRDSEKYTIEYYSGSALEHRSEFVDVETLNKFYERFGELLKL